MYTTQHLLRVNINLVSSGNNDQNPFTRFDGPDGSTDNSDFWIGYHQDTTDLQGRVPQSQIRAGHYESLKKIEEAPAKSVDDQNELETRNDEVVTALKNEEAILKLLGSNRTVVESAINRLNVLKVQPEDFLESDICFVLLTHVYPNFSFESSTGKSVRKLIKKFENVLKTAIDYDGEPLDITVVEPAEPPRTFRNIFRRNPESQAQTTHEIDCPDIQPVGSPELPSDSHQEIFQPAGRVCSTSHASFQNVPCESTRLPSTSVFVTCESPMEAINDIPKKRKTKRRVPNNTDSSEETSRNAKRRRLAEFAAENIVEETARETLEYPFESSLPNPPPLRRSARNLSKTSTISDISSFSLRRR